MNFLCLFFVTFLLVLGFIDLIKIVLKRTMLKNKTVPMKEVKIPIYGHCENIEFIIRKIVLKYTWITECTNLKIIIINNGADYETLQICEHLAKSHSILSINE